MRELLDKLKYTKAYSTAPDVANPFWYTEFVGGGINVASDVSDFEDIVGTMGVMFSNRTRDKNSPFYGTWQTMHSSIYDIGNLKLDIVVQEDGEEIEFELRGE